MKFSIVLPVYNGASFIERALTSVLDQKGVELEAIVIDGGSSDGTTEIIRKYEDRLAAFVSEKDRGQCDAINKGFARATGDLFGWLCHDDALAPQALAHVAELFGSHPEAGMVAGACERIYGDGHRMVTTPTGDVLGRIGYMNGIDQPSCFWKANLHRAAGELDESYNHALDWDWWNRLKQCGAKMETTTRVLSEYYFPEGSKTSAHPDANLKEAYRIIKTYGPCGGQLADAYLYLYEHYDLAGCFDKPCRAPRKLRKEFPIVVNALKQVFGEEYINGYNWQWISQQKRNLVWR